MLVAIGWEVMAVESDGWDVRIWAWIDRCFLFVHRRRHIGNRQRAMLGLEETKEKSAVDVVMGSKGECGRKDLRGQGEKFEEKM